MRLVFGNLSLQQLRDIIDERFHLEKSTDAAIEYLKKSYEKF